MSNNSEGKQLSSSKVRYVTFDFAVVIFVCKYKNILLSFLVINITYGIKILRKAMNMNADDKDYSDDEIFFGKLSLKEVKKHVMMKTHRHSLS